MVRCGARKSCSTLATRAEAANAAQPLKRNEKKKKKKHNSNITSFFPSFSKQIVVADTTEIFLSATIPE